MRTAVRILALVAVAGCSATPAPSGADGIPGPTRHFVAPEVSFDYPGSWREGHFDVVSSFSSSIVYLSTSPLADPCDRGANSIACIREAAAALDRDGVLVEWSHHGFPGWVFDPTKGQRVAVGGRPATVEDAAPTDLCGAIGGEREMTVTIDDPAAQSNWVEVRACLRGPDVEALRADIGRMLGSVAWH
jgi:hypothetical protein